MPPRCVFFAQRSSHFSHNSKDLPPVKNSQTRAPPHGQPHSLHVDCLLVNPSGPGEDEVSYLMMLRGCCLCLKIYPHRRHQAGKHHLPQPVAHLISTINNIWRRAEGKINTVPRVRDSTVTLPSSLCRFVPEVFVCRTILNSYMNISHSFVSLESYTGFKCITTVSRHE